jgi:hypothetical protein
LGKDWDLEARGTSAGRDLESKIEERPSPDDVQFSCMPLNMVDSPPRTGRRREWLFATLIRQAFQSGTAVPGWGSPSPDLYPIRYNMGWSSHVTVWSERNRTIVSTCQKDVGWFRGRERRRSVEIEQSSDNGGKTTARNEPPLITCTPVSIH